MKEEKIEAGKKVLSIYDSTLNSVNPILADDGSSEERAGLISEAALDNAIEAADIKSQKEAVNTLKTDLRSFVNM